MMDFDKCWWLYFVSDSHNNPSVTGQVKNWL
jgi:hypothetical protein